MILFDDRMKEEKTQDKLSGVFTPTLSPSRSRASSTGKLKRTPSTTSLPVKF